MAAQGEHNKWIALALCILPGNLGLHRFYEVNAYGHPWIKVKRSVEELFLNLRYGNFKRINQAIVHRLKKMSGNYDYI